MDDRRTTPDAPRTCRNHRLDSHGFARPVDHPRPEIRTPYRVGSFRHGPWTGHLETVAARLTDLPKNPGYRESVAHVRVVARYGTTVADLTWEAPAGTDLDGTLSRGTAALSATLDAVAP